MTGMQGGKEVNQEVLLKCDEVHKEGYNIYNEDEMDQSAVKSIVK